MWPAKYYWEDLCWFGDYHPLGCDSQAFMLPGWVVLYALHPHFEWIRLIRGRYCEIKFQWKVSQSNREMSLRFISWLFRKYYGNWSHDPKHVIAEPYRAVLISRLLWNWENFERCREHWNGDQDSGPTLFLALSKGKAETVEQKLLRQQPREILFKRSVWEV